jgi:hypothetical protein
MNKWQSLLILAVVLCIAFGGLGLARSALAKARSYTLDWCVVGGGGSASTQLSGTVGQTAIGWSTGAQELGSGFWYGVGAAGGHKLYLPLTIKSH